MEGSFNWGAGWDKNFESTVGRDRKPTSFPSSDSSSESSSERFSSPGNGHNGDGDDKDTCRLRDEAVESEITGEAAKELSGWYILFQSVYLGSISKSYPSSKRISNWAISVSENDGVTAWLWRFVGAELNSGTYFNPVRSASDFGLGFTLPSLGLKAWRSKGNIPVILKPAITLLIAIPWYHAFENNWENWNRVIVLPGFKTK